MDTIDLITKIVGNTIGIDLMSVTPMTDEELKQWNENQKMERDKWEEEHPEQVTAYKAWMEKQNSKKPYTPTEEEVKLIKEILKMDDKWFEIMEIYIYNDGDICVTTPKKWWMSLCGREWCVNLKEKTSKLVALS